MNQKQNERLIKERAEQGLPPNIEDPIALARVAMIVQRALAKEGIENYPPAHLPVEAVDSVYFMRNRDGLIKIGRSYNPEARLKAIGANVPGVELLGTMPNGNREKEFHRRFAAYRAYGEWFHPAHPILALLEELKWKPATNEQTEEKNVAQTNDD
jgi:hypothetical protein